MKNRIKIGLENSLINSANPINNKILSIMKHILLILAVALTICLFPMPYGYYIFIRYFAAIVFAVMAYDLYQKQENKRGAIIFLAMAILFQPFIKIPLGRTIWNIVDVISAIILFAFWWEYKERAKGISSIDAIMKDMNRKLFPGGSQQMEKEAKLLHTKLQEKYPLEEVKNVFMYVSSMFLISQDKTQDAIVTRAMNRPNNRLDRKSIITIYQFVAAKALNQNKNNAVSDVEFMVQHLNGRGNSGCNSNTIPNGYGEYGLTATNPVPAKGIFANTAYLSKLRTLDGEELEWERRGSTGAPNIEMPIDIYHITTKSGRDMGNIYISPYQNHTSTKAPKGFIHIENI